MHIWKNSIKIKSTSLAPERLWAIEVSNTIICTSSQANFKGNTCERCSNFNDSQYKKILPSNCMKIIIRPSYQFFDPVRFEFSQEKILSTSYLRGAKYDDAPLITDCVTAVRWLLSTSSDFLLPMGYIGDLPRILLDSWSRISPIQDARAGDLIFFERMSLTHQKYMVNHVGVMISQMEFIHSSKSHNGKIHRIDDAWYMDNILEESFLAFARDPRTPE